MALTSQIRYAFAANNTLTTGAGKASLAFGDITAKYLVNGGTLQSLTTETITTLGTYQAPTSSAHIRIKELAAAEPTTGIYEIHFHDTQLATGTKLWLFLSATGAKFQPLEIDLSGGGAGAGPGADSVTLTITDDGAIPIPDAEVWITTTAASSPVYAGYLLTNAQGEVTFMLNAGDTYYLWMQANGYNSIEGQSFVAVAD